MKKILLLSALFFVLSGCIHPKHFQREESISVEKYRGVRIIIENNAAKDTTINQEELIK